MSFIDQLNQDMKQAMKDKDKKKLSVIRMLKAAMQNESIKLGRDLSEDESLTVLSRELKQRKDSLQEFENAGRQDLADNVKEEIQVIDLYMPEQLSEEELLALVNETIQNMGATTKADMGKVMGAIMPKVKGKADGSVINRLVLEQLN